jgi:hypothetical protein
VCVCVCVMFENADESRVTTFIYRSRCFVVYLTAGESKAFFNSDIPGSVMSPEETSKFLDFAGCKNAPGKFVTIFFGGSENHDFRGPRNCTP